MVQVKERECNFKNVVQRLPVSEPFGMLVKKISEPNLHYWIKICSVVQRSALKKKYPSILLYAVRIENSWNRST